MSPLERATTLLNSQPLSGEALQGKVVLVEFWTYTCINWRRQLSYVRAWAEKYKQHGLIVVGVHSPEFSFERDVENVRWAAEDMRVDYPIAVDSDHAVWRGFHNEYWPALYWFSAAVRTTLADAGYDGWGAAATASSAALGGLFFLLVAVVAIVVCSIAGSGNHALTSGLNDFV